MMPPIENELVESDFDNAVIACLYLAEDRRERAYRKSQAIETANALARILAPLWGGKVEEDEDAIYSGCTHAFNENRICVFCGRTLGQYAQEVAAKKCPPHRLVNGRCVECNYIVENGVARYGEMPVECETHDLENGVCRKCGGREWNGQFITKGTPRVIGRTNYV